LGIEITEANKDYVEAFTDNFFKGILTVAGHNEYFGEKNLFIPNNTNNGYSVNKSFELAPKDVNSFRNIVEQSILETKKYESDLKDVLNELSGERVSGIIKNAFASVKADEIIKKIKESKISNIIVLSGNAISNITNDKDTEAATLKRYGSYGVFITKSAIDKIKNADKQTRINFLSALVAHEITHLTNANSARDEIDEAIAYRVHYSILKGLGFTGEYINAIGSELVYYLQHSGINDDAIKNIINRINAYRSVNNRGVSAILPNTREDVDRMLEEGESALKVSSKIAIKEFPSSVFNPIGFIKAHNTRGGKIGAGIVSASFYLPLIAGIIVSAINPFSIPIAIGIAASALVAAASNLITHTAIDASYLSNAETLEDENSIMAIANDRVTSIWDLLTGNKTAKPQAVAAGKYSIINRLINSKEFDAFHDDFKNLDHIPSDYKKYLYLFTDKIVNDIDKRGGKYTARIIDDSVFETNRRSKLIEDAIIRSNVDGADFLMLHRVSDPSSENFKKLFKERIKVVFVDGEWETDARYDGYSKGNAAALDGLSDIDNKIIVVPSNIDNINVTADIIKRQYDRIKALDDSRIKAVLAQNEQGDKQENAQKISESEKEIIDKRITEDIAADAAPVMQTLDESGKIFDVTEENIDKIASAVISGEYVSLTFNKTEAEENAIKQDSAKSFEYYARVNQNMDALARALTTRLFPEMQITGDASSPYRNLHEDLKNAFVHGNHLEGARPVYLGVSSVALEDGRIVNSLSVLNKRHSVSHDEFAKQEKPNYKDSNFFAELRAYNDYNVYSKSAGLHGRGLGASIDADGFYFSARGSSNAQENPDIYVQYSLLGEGYAGNKSEDSKIKALLSSREEKNKRNGEKIQKILDEGKYLQAAAFVAWIEFIPSLNPSKFIKGHDTKGGKTGAKIVSASFYAPLSASIAAAVAIAAVTLNPFALLIAAGIGITSAFLLNMGVHTAIDYNYFDKTLQDGYLGNENDINAVMLQNRSAVQKTSDAGHSFINRFLREKDKDQSLDYFKNNLRKNGRYSDLFSNEVVKNIPKAFTGNVFDEANKPVLSAIARRIDNSVFFTRRNLEAGGDIYRALGELRKTEGLSIKHEDFLSPSRYSDSPDTQFNKRIKILLLDGEWAGGKNTNHIEEYLTGDKSLAYATDYLTDLDNKTIVIPAMLTDAREIAVIIARQYARIKNYEDLKISEIKDETEKQKAIDIMNAEANKQEAIAAKEILEEKTRNYGERLDFVEEIFEPSKRQLAQIALTAQATRDSFAEKFGERFVNSGIGNWILRVAFAPVYERRQLAEIAETERNGDEAKAAQLREKFLAAHSGYTDESRQEYARGVNSITDAANAAYNAALNFTKIKPIAVFAANIANIIAHSQWNREQGADGAVLTTNTVKLTKEEQARAEKLQSAAEGLVKEYLSKGVSITERQAKMLINKGGEARFDSSKPGLFEVKPSGNYDSYGRGGQDRAWYVKQGSDQHTNGTPLETRFYWATQGQTVYITAKGKDDFIQANAGQFLDQLIRYLPQNRALSAQMLDKYSQDLQTASQSANAASIQKTLNGKILTALKNQFGNKIALDYNTLKTTKSNISVAIVSSGNKTLNLELNSDGIYVDGQKVFNVSNETLKALNLPLNNKLTLDSSQETAESIADKLAYNNASAWSFVKNAVVGVLEFLPSALLPSKMFVAIHNPDFVERLSNKKFGEFIREYQKIKEEMKADPAKYGLRLQGAKTIKIATAVGLAFGISAVILSGAALGAFFALALAPIIMNVAAHTDYNQRIDNSQISDAANQRLTLQFTRKLLDEGKIELDGKDANLRAKQVLYLHLFTDKIIKNFQNLGELRDSIYKRDSRYVNNTTPERESKVKEALKELNFAKDFNEKYKGPKLNIKGEDFVMLQNVNKIEKLRDDYKDRIVDGKIDPSLFNDKIKVLFISGEKASSAYRDYIEKGDAQAMDNLSDIDNKIIAIPSEVSSIKEIAVILARQYVLIKNRELGELAKSEEEISKEAFIQEAVAIKGVFGNGLHRRSNDSQWNKKMAAYSQRSDAAAKQFPRETYSPAVNSSAFKLSAILPNTRADVDAMIEEGESPLKVSSKIAVKEFFASLNPIGFVRAHDTIGAKIGAGIVSASFYLPLIAGMIVLAINPLSIPIAIGIGASLLVSAASNLITHMAIDYSYFVKRDSTDIIRTQNDLGTKEKTSVIADALTESSSAEDINEAEKPHDSYKMAKEIRESGLLKDIDKAEKYLEVLSDEVVDALKQYFDMDIPKETFADIIQTSIDNESIIGDIYAELAKLGVSFKHIPSVFIIDTPENYGMSVDGNMIIIFSSAFKAERGQHRLATIGELIAHENTHIDDYFEDPNMSHFKTESRAFKNEYNFLQKIGINRPSILQVAQAFEILANNEEAVKEKIKKQFGAKALSVNPSLAYYQYFEFLMNAPQEAKGKKDFLARFQIFDYNKESKDKDYWDVFVYKSGEILIFPKDYAKPSKINDPFLNYEENSGVSEIEGFNATQDAAQIADIVNEGQNENIKTKTFYHGGLDESFNLESLDVFRKAQKQQKRGRNYAGFYLFDADGGRQSAQRYALQAGEGKGIGVFEINADAKILELTENGAIERITKEKLEELSKQYDMIKGANILGKTEYVLLNKKVIQNYSYEKPQTSETSIEEILKDKLSADEIISIDVNLDPSQVTGDDVTQYGIFKNSKFLHSNVRAWAKEQLLGKSGEDLKNRVFSISLDKWKGDKHLASDILSDFSGVLIGALKVKDESADFTLSEVLKNAVSHGNHSDFSKPFYIYISESGAVFVINEKQPQMSLEELVLSREAGFYGGGIGTLGVEGENENDYKFSDNVSLSDGKNLYVASFILDKDTAGDDRETALKQIDPNAKLRERSEMELSPLAYRVPQIARGYIANVSVNDSAFFNVINNNGQISLAENDERVEVKEENGKYYFIIKDKKLRGEDGVVTKVKFSQPISGELTANIRVLGEGYRIIADLAASGRIADGIDIEILKLFSDKRIENIIKNFNPGAVNDENAIREIIAASIKETSARKELIKDGYKMLEDNGVKFERSAPVIFVDSRDEIYDALALGGEVIVISTKVLKDASGKNKPSLEMRKSVAVLLAHENVHIEDALKEELVNLFDTESRAYRIQADIMRKLGIANADAADAVADAFAALDKKDKEGWLKERIGARASAVPNFYYKDADFKLNMSGENVITIYDINLENEGVERQWLFKYSKDGKITLTELDLFEGTSKIIASETPKETESFEENPVSTFSKETQFQTDETSMQDNFQKDFVVFWHGTPFDYDKFDANQIGQGEGISKYGKGIYLSRGKRLAPFYANIRSKDAPIHFGSTERLENPQPR
ncbi:MAG: hypothetical protein LBO62_03770, partial [Endomicrobium sp.]|nr:hypothetical protein [Endomicrobium sp.]